LFGQAARKFALPCPHYHMPPPTLLWRVQVIVIRGENKRCGLQRDGQRLARRVAFPRILHCSSFCFGRSGNLKAIAQPSAPDRLEQLWADIQRPPFAGDAARKAPMETLSTGADQSLAIIDSGALEEIRGQFWCFVRHLAPVDSQPRAAPGLSGARFPSPSGAGCRSTVDCTSGAVL